MNKEESSGQDCILATSLKVVVDLRDNSFGQHEDAQPIQKVQQKIDEVITPNLLARPDVVQSEGKIQDRSRTQ